MSLKNKKVNQSHNRPEVPRGFQEVKVTRLRDNGPHAHLATASQHVPTQHDVLPQHLVCKYELNCEYCNITLARNRALWWWSDKIETFRSVLKCFIWNYMCILWLINWNNSTKMHGATIRFIIWPIACFVRNCCYFLRVFFMSKGINIKRWVHSISKHVESPSAYITLKVIHCSVWWGTRWRSWLGITSWKVAGSIPDGRTVAEESNQPVTEISTRNISWGVKAASA